MLFSVRKKKKRESTLVLDALIAPVESEFERFKKAMALDLTTHISILDAACAYLLNQKGKKVRPLLVLLSSGLCGPIAENSLRAAVSVETLHTATLVHDDVVDHSGVRRGIPTINAVWSNKVAVLVGDFLLAQSLRSALAIRNFEVLDILSEVTRRMSRGELQQVEKRGDLSLTEDTYIRMVADKTAALFAASCQLGALMAGGTPAQQDALRRFGEYVGIAFQIRDDLFDLEASSRRIGKPTGVDIRNNPISLPLIHALDRAPAEDRADAIKLLKDQRVSKRQKQLIAYAKTYGGLSYAADRARDYAGRARTLLEEFPASPYRDSLNGFVRFAAERPR